AFSSNDERTAKRISDALGTATELRAQRNYAGHRLAPWLSHVMVSRQETARPLLTPGEVMQLPSTSVTRLHRSYDPVRLPPAPPPLATLRPRPSRRSGLPRLPEPPFRRAVPTTPADQAGARVDCFPARAAFPKWQEGRQRSSYVAL